MVTKKLKKTDAAFLAKLGERVKKIILEDRGYTSLDAFAIENHDLVTKPTLYQICDGKRDLKISTLRGLAKALQTTADKLISDL